MTAPRRVYRATAVYLDHDVTRHFLTKRSRDQWATQRRLGYEERYHGLDDYVPPIPPAQRVEVADSDPVTFGERSKALASVWSMHLDTMLDDRLADGTPTIEVVLALNPELRRRLQELL